MVTLTMRRRTLYRGLAAVFVLAFLGVAVTMQISAHGNVSSPNVIHACKNISSGETKIVGANDACKKNWISVDLQGSLVGQLCPPGQFVIGIDQDGNVSCSCGDGTVSPGVGEQCDDGNTLDGDGCSSTCTLEIVCGDGVVEGAEQCDDGNTDGGDGCSSACTVTACDGHFDCGDAAQDTGDYCNFEVGLCGPPGFCGDGLLDPGEQCDDGNINDGDGCDFSCTIEAECVDDADCAGSEGGPSVLTKPAAPLGGIRAIRTPTVGPPMFAGSTVPANSPESVAETAALSYVGSRHRASMMDNVVRARSVTSLSSAVATVSVCLTQRGLRAPRIANVVPPRFAWSAVATEPAASPKFAATVS